IYSSPVIATPSENPVHFNDASNIGRTGLSYPSRIVMKASYHTPCTIQFFYRSGSGGIIQGPEYGNPYDYCKTEIFELEPKERIIRVEVCTGTYQERANQNIIHHIKFITSIGREAQYGLCNNPNTKVSQEYKGFICPILVGLPRINF
ncbi:unnamed protein product, partial [Didymodactylos carnosus]